MSLAGNIASADRLRLGSLHFALLLSGASALVYESVWGRMLHQVFGVSDLAVATVLAAFFLGLGLGSALGGLLASRVRRHALAYALLETGVGLYALLSLLLLPEVHSLYTGIGAGASFAWLTAIRLGIALVILLPPTILMGATLPVLIAAISGPRRDWSGGATWLYAANTTGAVLGAGAAGFWLVPSFGAGASIRIAVVGSLLAGALVWATWRRRESGGSVPTVAGGSESDHSPIESPATGSTPSDRGGLELAMALACVSGFTALAGEVLWTRLLRIIVHGTTQAFAAMLVNYLAGIAVGSALADRWGRRIASPARAFGLAQMAIAALIALSLLLSPQLPRILWHLSGNLSPHDAWVILVVSGLLLFPLALAIGAGIPLAWRIAGGTGAEAGRRSGRVLAANTLGGLLGSLGAGLVFVPWCGLEGSLYLTMLLHLLTAAGAFRFAGAATGLRRLGWIGSPLVLATLVYLAHPTLDLPYFLRARISPQEAVLAGPGPGWEKAVRYLREGRNTTVSIIQHEQFGFRLCNDGLAESGMSLRRPGFGAETALLGGIPSLFARDRERVLVVGLGAGHTATVLLAGPWKQVEVVELEEAVHEAARALHELLDRPCPIDDPRCTLVFDDARARLALSPAGSYDAVVSQPSHPWLAGSSALYTLEFFKDVKRTLRPGGVFSLWVNQFRMDLPHLQRIVATLNRVFPHVRVFVAETTSIVFCAALESCRLNATTAERLTGDSGLLRFLEPHGIRGMADLVSLVEIDEPSTPGFAQGFAPIVDDLPVLEFELARLPDQQWLETAKVEDAVRRIPWLAPETYMDLPETTRWDTLFGRIRRVQSRKISLERVLGTMQMVGAPAAEVGLIEGALSEALGWLPAALKHYDECNLPLGAARADALRANAGLYEEALRIAESRATVPPSADGLLRCAAALQTAAAAKGALAIAAKGAVEDPSPRRRVLEAFASGGAPAVVALGQVALEAAEGSEEFAILAERCAAQAGDVDAFRRASFVHARARWSESMRAARIGMDFAHQGNLEGAAFHLGRALVSNPGHAPAAGALARVLGRQAEKDESQRPALMARARKVLEDALQACRGLSDESTLLLEAAVELQIAINLPDSGTGEAFSTLPTRGESK